MLSFLDKTYCLWRNKPPYISHTAHDSVSPHHYRIHINYKDALWYCFALVTTIGFGDITAVTDLGRTISVVLGIYGIIVVALITSIIVNFYGEIKKAHPEEEAGAENDCPE